MRAEEKVYVEYYEATCHEDIFDKGEQEEITSYWTHSDIPVKGGFASIELALRAICNENYLAFDKRDWINFAKEFGDEIGRFDGDILVDKDNLAATEDQIAKWKRGELKLYNCHFVAQLAVRAVRQLTAEECMGFDA